MKRLTSAKARQWQGYNRWRANHRELDRQRRLERISGQPRPEPCGPVPFKPKRAKAWARVRIEFADGSRHSFSVRLGPFGLLPSPTTAGTALRRLLQQKAG